MRLERYINEDRYATESRTKKISYREAIKLIKTKCSEADYLVDREHCSILDES
ncbi:MAG: hypothetical protein ACOC56_00085 [Atribacterota bacterium]